MFCPLYYALFSDFFQYIIFANNYNTPQITNRIRYFVFLPFRRLELPERHKIFRHEYKVSYHNKRIITIFFNIASSDIYALTYIYYKI